MLPLVIPLVEAAAEYAWGAHQKSQADNRLKALGNVPQYTVSPELQGAYDQAFSMSQYGATPQEKGAFRQNVAQDINTKTQRMKDIGGGNLARTISGIGKIDEMGAENKFAATDADLHRKNIAHANMLAREIQNQKNRASGAAISEFNTQRGYDQQAGAEGVKNMFGGLDLAGMGVAHSITPTPLNPYEEASQQMLKNNMPTTMAPRRIQPTTSTTPDDLNYTDLFHTYSGYNPTVSAGNN